ncbi:hypothetical protein [Changpingibacter yushuensis]|uniref:hypothetical protein n=1 Tax=Changpingibacter yushuensis TaxID=2758440 RepID=UPI00165E7A3B|nr:hypothetical protein [Changpingibacter yushuensis]
MQQETAKYVPLSVREGRRPPFEPTVGVPGYLSPALTKWLNRQFPKANGSSYASFEASLDSERIHKLFRALRIDYEESLSDQDMYVALLDEFLEGDDEISLDIIDYLLFTGATQCDELEAVLFEVDHEYRLDADHARLVRRVDGSVWAAYEEALAPADEASNDVASAWAKTYSRDTDPEGAWDDATRAVEALLKPIVSPNDGKATLGKMISAIRAKEEKWACDLPGIEDKSPVQQFVDALQVVGYRPDRHGGSDGVTDSATSAMVVLQAVTIVGWLRDGAFRRVD